MLFGLCIGLAVAAAIYVRDRAPDQAAAVQPQPAPAPRAPKAPASSAPAPADAPAGPESRFDFYDMLPNFEVVIPEQDLDARPDVGPGPVTAPGAYVLQAGSFASLPEADRMKAQIALLGIPSRIQKVSIDDKVYHRVRIGPVEDLDRLNDMRRRLRDARVEVMVIRIAE